MNHNAMARRSSARLRNKGSSTAKQVPASLHAAAPRSPAGTPTSLEPLHESDEMPGAFPASASPPSLRSPAPFTERLKSATPGLDATPKRCTRIGPSDEDMHPQQHHRTTAKPFAKTRDLDIANISSYTEPVKRASKQATLHDTPTRSNTGSSVMSSDPQFAFRREHSLELSPEAKKLMNEKREEAACIKEQMRAGNEHERGNVKMGVRRIAVAKSKRSRFSDAHMAQFQQMDSIAGHASAFRAHPDRQKAGINMPPQDMKSSANRAHFACQKTLKRSASKAQLDATEAQAIKQNPSPVKPATAQVCRKRPLDTSCELSTSRTAHANLTPAKRLKQSKADDVFDTSPLSKIESAPPQTPMQIKTLQNKPDHPDQSSIAFPTQASLARAASIKSSNVTKIPAPLERSPPKFATTEAIHDSQKPQTPSLARSPLKLTTFSKPKSDQPSSNISPLLARAPYKASPVKDSVDSHTANKPSTSDQAPLLFRSPLKVSTANVVGPEVNQSNATATKLLSRSPTKIPLNTNQGGTRTQQTPGTSGENSFMGRLDLLRSSPMKSILRSPQRLYSDDPAKVAAGTHLATPTKNSRNANNLQRSRGSPSTQKHVDFTASTKARDEAAPKERMRTPYKSPTPQAATQFEASTSPSIVTYPILPSSLAHGISELSTAKKESGQTTTPGNFTFRAGEHGIIFGESPSKMPVADGNDRPSTIRHVPIDTATSSETQLPVASQLPAKGSKKRKFEFENDISTVTSNHVENKENLATDGLDRILDGDEQRPAKRPKSNQEDTRDEIPRSPEKKPMRVPTLGVKPKGGATTKPTVISQARLNALAQPKMRA